MSYKIWKGPTLPSIHQFTAKGHEAGFIIDLPRQQRACKVREAAAETVHEN